MVMALKSTQIFSQVCFSSQKYKMVVTAGKQLRTIATAFNQKLNIKSNSLASLFQVRNYAARKGTRERAKKKKVKVEVKPVGFIPHNRRMKKNDVVALNVVRFDDSKRPDPIDDVWIRKFHKWRVFPFADAIQCHKETHHPECYNMPNAFIYALIELDMQGEKPTKVVETFTRTVDVPHIFDHGKHNTVIVFAKTREYLELAEKSGATLTGDTELISKVQSGEISTTDFTAVVAHPEIMPQLSVIRGLLKKKFPNPRTGTLGLDIPAMVKKVLHGIKYEAIPHEQQKLYGQITVPIGRLSMDARELEENFVAIIKDIDQVKPKREGLFITRTKLTSPPSSEELKIDFEKYLSTGFSEDVNDDSDNEEEIVRSNVQ